MIDHNLLRDRVHLLNREAGWWHDLKTGACILETRNRPEMLLLVLSEVCEACHNPNDPDGHVPQFSTFKVEIADAAIRILDLAGGDNIDLETGDFVFDDITNWFSELTNLVAHDALQAYRKGKTEQYHEAIAKFYNALHTIAQAASFDLLEVVEAKLEYNANRADHKLEARKAPGGKAI